MFGLQLHALYGCHGNRFSVKIWCNDFMTFVYFRGKFHTDTTNRTVFGKEFAKLVLGKWKLFRASLRQLVPVVFVSLTALVTRGQSHATSASASARSRVCHCHAIKIKIKNQAVDKVKKFWYYRQQIKKTVLQVTVVLKLKYSSKSSAQKLSSLVGSRHVGGPH